MDGQPTRAGLAALAPAAWRDFFAFLKSPVLPKRAAGIGMAGLGAITRLFPLDLLLMTLLIAGFAGLTALGLELPEHALEGLELGPALIVFILVAAPIGEEVVFRGWLSGRPGHLFALLALAAGGGLAVLAARASTGPAASLATLGFATLALAAALLALWFGRRRVAWPWFQRHFGWFYFASALAFAGIHLANFTEGAAAILLPLTLPQFVLGLILGYIRVHHGLWASVLFHALHNGVFIGLLVAATG